MLAEREPETWPVPPAAACAQVSSSGDPQNASKYYRARYYDPKLGRFISEDPTGFRGGLNFYGYAENNPPAFSDPNGTTVYRTGYRAASMAIKYAGNKARPIGVRLGGWLTEAQAKLRRRLGQNVCVYGKNKRDAVDRARRLEESAVGDKGRQLFHDKDAHVRAGNQPHWQTEGVDGHTFIKSAGAGVAALLAENAMAAAEAGGSDSSITTMDIALIGAWDIAVAIDPIFLTDFIEYVAQR